MDRQWHCQKPTCMHLLRGIVIDQDAVLFVRALGAHSRNIVGVEPPPFPKASFAFLLLQIIVFV